LTVNQKETGRSFVECLETALLVPTQGMGTRKKSPRGAGKFRLTGSFKRFYLDHSKPMGLPEALINGRF